MSWAGFGRFGHMSVFRRHSTPPYRDAPQTNRSLTSACTGYTTQLSYYNGKVFEFTREFAFNTSVFSNMNIAGILEALIPVCGGIYGTLLGFKRIKPRNLNPRAAALVAQLRWLGPLVILFGLSLLWQTNIDKRPSVEEIVRGMRQKVTLPVAVDEVTRLDAFDHEGQRIIYRMTITKPPQTESERDALIAAMRQLLRSQGCKDENYQRLFQQDIAVEIVYTIGDTRYPGILVTRADCDRS